MDKLFFLVNIRRETFLQLTIFVLVSVLLLILPRDFKSDLSAFIFKFTYGPFYAFKNYVKELEGVQNENEKLRLKLIELSLRNSWLNEEHLENERLRKLLEFRSELEYNVIPAEVLSTEPNRRYFSVLIDKGSGDGLRRNMPVVNIHGLVGKVVDVSYSSAVVQLMIDPNFRASAQDQKTRVFGIIKPGSGSSLRLDNVPLREDIKIGDRVITSGLGGIFPPGIKIGVVTAVESEEDLSRIDRSFGIFKRVDVTPYVDLSSLEELFVLDAKR
jgi:rod shape-determining protein MreC